MTIGSFGRGMIMTSTSGREGHDPGTGSAQAPGKITRRAACAGAVVVVTMLVVLTALQGWPARSKAVAQQATKPGNSSWDVRDFGARGDGHSDDTAAFQRALDAAGRAGGATVFAPRGAYRFAGRLNVPEERHRGHPRLLGAGKWLAPIRWPSSVPAVANALV